MGKNDFKNLFQGHYMYITYIFLQNLKFMMLENFTDIIDSLFIEIV